MLFHVLTSSAATAFHWPGRGTVMDKKEKKMRVRDAVKRQRTRLLVRYGSPANRMMDGDIGIDNVVHDAVDCQDDDDE